MDHKTIKKQNKNILSPSLFKFYHYSKVQDNFWIWIVVYLNKCNINILLIISNSYRPRPTIVSQVIGSLVDMSLLSRQIWIFDFSNRTQLICCFVLNIESYRLILNKYFVLNPITAQFITTVSNKKSLNQ